MSHITHDIEQNPIGSGFVALSHNFPAIKGTGQTKEEAKSNMDQQIKYMMDNQPLAFKAEIKDRLNRKLLCRCGEKLTEKPLGVWKGTGLGAI